MLPLRIAHTAPEVAQIGLCWALQAAVCLPGVEGRQCVRRMMMLLRARPRLVTEGDEDGLLLRCSSSVVASFSLVVRKLDGSVFLLGCLAPEQSVVLQFCRQATRRVLCLVQGGWGSFRQQKLASFASRLMFRAGNVTVKLVLWPWCADISFDVERASALAEGARRNLVLRDWQKDAAQRASALRLSFQGNVLFGAELEEKLHKLFKEKEHSSSFHSTLGDHRLFRKKSPVQAPSGRQPFCFRHGYSPYSNEGDEDGGTWG
ncbi:hypothetical protein NDU88_010865 [Pleurodeles waltl]|uniref:Uncharacterized protein n=1 Tax=Pleurodeles waltl TaxID=8319 RepID=A0AAV7QVK8_PLEWA|nr:hypothetical protein NDU88_010865 [Pleurodeles waltl]